MPQFPVSNPVIEFNSLTSNLPVLTREAFALQTGLTAPTVYSMCDRGYLPIIHFGRRVFVNLEALRRQCAVNVIS
jgi:hypothetical protein